MPAGTGSRTTFGYFDDTGVERLVEMDKSNANSSDLGFAVASSTQLRQAFHKGKTGVVMRYVNCFRIGTNGEQVNRSFPIATLAVWAALKGSGSPTVVVSGLTYFVQSFIGEKQYVPSIIDTALTDAADPT